jgi:hypothetical protein
MLESPLINLAESQRHIVFLTSSAQTQKVLLHWYQSKLVRKCIFFSPIFPIIHYLSRCCRGAQEGGRSAPAEAHWGERNIYPDESYRLGTWKQGAKKERRESVGGVETWLRSRNTLGHPRMATAPGLDPILRSQNALAPDIPALPPSPQPTALFQSRNPREIRRIAGAGSTSSVFHYN